MTVKHNIPPLELLNANHAFPGPYIFKIIVLAEEGIEKRITLAIKEELEMTEHPTHTTRDTTQHIAITVEVLVPSAHKVQAVYKRLLQEKCVVLLL
jgi:uncharacterized protein